MRRWARDLGLGCRFVAKGGPAAWLRLTMTALGVGIGVALLLFAASMPNLVDGYHQRGAARDMASSTGPATAHTILVHRSPNEYRGHLLHGVLVKAEGTDPIVPPGLSALPADGEMVVSPALRDLLDTPAGADLRRQYPARIVGTIADAGLTGPKEYAFYLGSDRLTSGQVTSDTLVIDGVHRIDRFGAPQTQSNSVDPILLLLGVVGVTILLVPVLVFIATAMRFGSDARDRQQAALRLLGTDRSMARRIAAAEALLGSLGGLAIGAVAFLAARQLAPLVSIADASVFPTDVSPEPILAALVAVTLPVAAVLVTMIALRRVVAEPLGVVRRAVSRRRRLWWRLAMAVVGLGLIVLAAQSGDVDDAPMPVVVAGVLLLLVGVATLLPWLVEIAVRRLPAAGLPSQLAVRRLQLDSSGAGRMVSGITVAVAGAIALQTLLSAVDRQPTSPDLSVNSVAVTGTPPLSDAARTDLADRLRHTDGVRSTTLYRSVNVSPAADRDEDGWLLAVADCDTLRRIAMFGSCRDGDGFAVRSDDEKPPAVGRILAASHDTPHPTDGVRLTVPTGLHTVKARPQTAGRAGLMLTPAAAARLSITAAMPVTGEIVLDQSTPYAADHAVATAVRRYPTASLIAPFSSSDPLASIRAGLLAGAMLVLVVIGASLLLTVLEQVRSRRGPLAVLSAFGVRRGTMTVSVLWQTAIPVFLGLVLAVVAGTALSSALLQLADLPMWFDLSSVLGLSAAAAAVVAAVTALSMPALWRMMRPEAMRAE